MYSGSLMIFFLLDSIASFASIAQDSFETMEPDAFCATGFGFRFVRKICSFLSELKARGVPHIRAFPAPRSHLLLYKTLPVSQTCMPSCFCSSIFVIHIACPVWLPSPFFCSCSNEPAICRLAVDYILPEALVLYNRQILETFNVLIISGNSTSFMALLVLPFLCRFLLNPLRSLACLLQRPLGFTLKWFCSFLLSLPLLLLSGALRALPITASGISIYVTAWRIIWSGCHLLFQLHTILWHIKSWVGHAVG